MSYMNGMPGMNNPMGGSMNGNMMGNNMYSNWNNLYNANNMNMNNFINNNMCMSPMNNPMQMQMNMMLQQFYNQMQEQLKTTMALQQQINNFKSYSVNNNAKATDRLPKQDAYIDPFINIPGPKANLIFQTAKGNKITITAPYNITIHQVLIEFMKRVGLGPNALYSGFCFLFNGAKIDLKNKTKLVQELTNLGQVKQSHIVIVVVDTQNLIGS